MSAEYPRPKGREVRDSDIIQARADAEVVATAAYKAAYSEALIALLKADLGPSLEEQKAKIEADKAAVFTETSAACLKAERLRSHGWSKFNQARSAWEGAKWEHEKARAAWARANDREALSRAAMSTAGNVRFTAQRAAEVRYAASMEALGGKSP